MQTRTKLVALELTENAFALVWIVASVAALYLFVAALTLDGAWSSLLIALAAGAIGKWLSKAFREVKATVAEANYLPEK